MQEVHGGNIYKYKNIIDFSANINPLGVLPEVLTAASESLKQITNYPDINCSELRTSLASTEGIQKKYIICGNGAADLIFQIVLATRPKKALLIAPGFAEYEQALNMINADIEFYYLKEENEYEVRDNILNYINEDLDIMFICNPNNPTGKTVDTYLLEKIVQETAKTKIILINNECFNDFLEESQKYSMVNKISSFKNIFILKAFTKMYAMPGLRLGYGLCSNELLIERMCRNRQPWSISIPAQAAGVKALENKDFKKQTVDYINKEREYLITNFRKLGIKYYESKANFILFKWLPNLKEQLIVERILIRDCSNYRGLERGYYRVAVKSRQENEQLVKALIKIKSESKEQNLKQVQEVV